MIRALTLCWLVLLGCSEKKQESKPGQDYGKACKPGGALVAPWTNFALPIAEGRVCSSTEPQTEVQYLDKPGTELQQAYEQAFTTAGYTKTRCTDAKGITPNCIYEKKTKQPAAHEVRVSVRAMPGERQVQIWLKTENGSYEAP